MMKKKTQRSTPKSDPGQWQTTEETLTAELHEDLRQAWKEMRKFARGLGDQRIYASGKAIMFSRKTCLFFVRPKKSYLEVVVFLPDAGKRPGFKSVKAVSKLKYAHTFKLVHVDQIEGDLAEAIQAAYRE